MGSFVAAIAFVFALAGCSGVTRTATDPPAEPASATPAPADTLPLPTFHAGESRQDVFAEFRPEAVPRAITPRLSATGDAWEVSETMGRYALAEFAGGGLISINVRRPWSAGLPLVDAHRIPELHAGMTRTEVYEAVGPGWPVARSLLAVDAIAMPIEAEMEAWSIRDRGLDTGHVLKVVFKDERAALVDHRWGREGALP